MSQARKTPIYGNCQVYGPDGKLMFRCLKKRANWYLSRNLAVITNEDPFSIKLTFTPKGKGESMDVLKLERKNQCVVCGTEELDILTKHHLVPFVYRQHFPTKSKNHSSLFIVPICRDCHYWYENNYARYLKEALAEAYSAPFNGHYDVEKNKALGVIKCLKQYSDRIPKDRLKFLRDELKQNLIDFGLYNDEDLTDFSALDEIKLKLDAESKEKVTYSHGKTVVSRIEDLNEFEQMWSKHFIDSMKPKHMPDYFFTALKNLVSEYS